MSRVVVGGSLLTRLMPFPTRGSVPALRCRRLLRNLKPARSRAAADELQLDLRALTCVADNRVRFPRSLRQLDALPRSVKVKRELQVASAAKDVRVAASARAAVDQSILWTEERWRTTIREREGGVSPPGDGGSTPLDK